VEVEEMQVVEKSEKQVVEGSSLELDWRKEKPE
jgi:hypothetical protein